MGSKLELHKLRQAEISSRTQLTASLTQLDPLKSISSALPLDVVKLLVWKDEDGRTVVHRTH